MLSRPLPALLALLVVSCAAQDPTTPYISSARKGTDFTGLRPLPLNYIPDQQCSGVIEHLACGARGARALQVSVSDARPYARVEVSDSLAAAAVHRRPAPDGRCHGVAHVQVSQSCALTQGEAHAAPTTRRALLALPAAHASHVS